MNLYNTSLQRRYALKSSRFATGHAQCFFWLILHELLLQCRAGIAIAHSTPFAELFSLAPSFYETKGKKIVVFFLKKIIQR